MSESHSGAWYDTWRIWGTFGQGGGQTNHGFIVEGSFISVLIDIQASGTNYILRFWANGTVEQISPNSPILWRPDSFTTNDDGTVTSFFFDRNLGGGHATLLEFVIDGKLIPPGVPMTTMAPAAFESFDFIIEEDDDDFIVDEDVA
jgi:hypothetical protein